MRFNRFARVLAVGLGFCAGSSTLPLLNAQEAVLGTPAPDRVGPDKLYPKPMTPGKADTVSVDDLTDEYECPQDKDKWCTYSQSHRRVSKKVHTQVYVVYEVPEAKRNIKSGEVDHFAPLCNGGSNDIQNLWYQPVKNPWNGKNFGYKEKDHLEAWVCTQVKAGKLDPKVAFERITSDWVAYYKEVNPKKVKFKD